MSSGRSVGRAEISPGSGCRRGLVLGEVLVLMAMLAILGMLALVVLGDGRRAARLGQCQANLRFFAMMTPTYAADNGDRMWGYSWAINQPENPFGVASSTQQAHSDQAVWIMHRIGGGFGPGLTRIVSWVPHVLYSSLPLLDYSGAKLPDIQQACPGDVNRFKWNRDPAGFVSGTYVPNPFASTIPHAEERRWAFSSSYQIGPAWWDQSPVGQRISNGGAFNTWLIPSGATFGQPRLADVAHPSQKAITFEDFSYHYGQGRQAYSGYPEARISMLMADGNVVVRSTSDANRAWNPNSPWSGAIITTTFSKNSATRNQWYPTPLNGLSSDSVGVYYIQTRGGLAGRDFDGPPAETGQP